MTTSVPFDPRVPFNRGQARAAGISRHELVGSRYHRLFYDTYVAAEVPLTTHLRATAALGVSPPGSYVSHFTAAELWGGVVPDVAEVHVTVPGELPRTRRQGVRAHAVLDRPEPVWLRRLPVSSPLQTFLDLAAAGLGLVDLVVLGDSLVRTCHLVPGDLAAAAAASRAPGAQRARHAARHVRDGVDSPQESRLRMLLVLAGLPEPAVNVILRREDGSWLARLDLSYPHLKLVIEYDGRQHAESTAQWQRDLRRREHLEVLGWRIVVITGQDLCGPEEVLNRVRDALLGRGGRAPRRFRTEWRRHFGH